MPATATVVKSTYATESMRLWRIRRIEINDKLSKDMIARLLELPTTLRRWGPVRKPVGVLQIGSCSDEAIGKFYGADLERAKSTYKEERVRQEGEKKINPTKFD